MEWTADVSAGDWIRERLATAPWPAVVPPGFDAYARIFHPADRDRPVGVAWPLLPYARHRREWDAFQDTDPEIEGEQIRWATAAAFGTTPHPLAQWDDLVERFREVPGEDGPRDAAGWRYGRPAVGQLEAHTLAAAARVLAAHTTTADDGCVAVWEGWGGIVGFYGTGPARVSLEFGEGDAGEARHADMLGRSIHDPFNNVFRQPTWQPGLLSDDVSNGARLSLPAREHILFRGGISAFTDAGWGERMPWRDAQHPWSVESPSLIWPADHAWVLVSEVDFDSTIVGGSAALVDALVADPGLEALPIPSGADLSSTGDVINR